MLLRQLTEDPLRKQKHTYFTYNGRRMDAPEAVLRGPLTKLKHTYSIYNGRTMDPLVRQLSGDPLTKLKRTYSTYNGRTMDPPEAALRGPPEEAKTYIFHV